MVLMLTPYLRGKGPSPQELRRPVVVSALGCDLPTCEAQGVPGSQSDLIGRSKKLLGSERGAAAPRGHGSCSVCLDQGAQHAAQWAVADLPTAFVQPHGSPFSVNSEVVAAPMSSGLALCPL